MADKWVSWYLADQELYQTDASWKDNGIVPYVDPRGAFVDEEHPWTCCVCWKRKKFGCLDSSRDHISQGSHCEWLKWQREARERLVLARGLGISPALSPSARPRETTSTAALQGPPPSSSTLIERCSWLLSDPDINGVPIARAALRVDVTRETTGRPFASSDIRRASMTCQTLPAHFWETPDSPQSALPPRVSAADAVDGLRTFPAFEAPPALSRSMASSVPAPASIGLPAPASSPKPPLRTSLPGMAGMIAKQPPPRTSQPPPRTSPKPPPPSPPGASPASAIVPPDEVQVPPSRLGGAPADASGRGAASVRAAEWCEQSSSEEDGGISSGS